MDEDAISLAKDLQAFKWYYVASCTIIFFDYFLTLSDEIEFAWKERKGPVFYLFLLNRYCAMSFCVITLFAYFSPLWTFEVCNRFAIVEWLQALLAAIPAEIVLLIRVYALTGSRKLYIVLLSLLPITQCITVIYAMAQHGQNNALPLPDLSAQSYGIDPFHVCILFSDPVMDTLYLAGSILFDSIVFIITLQVTIQYHKIIPRALLLQRIQRDGTLYFGIILTGNALWMLFSLCSRPGLKLINAHMILTSVMISRLTLSLRRVSHERYSAWSFKAFEFSDTLPRNESTGAGVS
ncbi:uncharacterized protein BT62DRAFT_84027 [Guyanagaster necrorhizus]|uniref:DUF6533 domain-containing protein n=1 Tax=Guyanagaster necrorhizus TaxID=856835 RepID=A0A9P8AST2_9AGAR|nr:uncharacterized protein BT62DRAFT_84027 [Guyanagaster necrorhizus MCA 3950]KAG7446733.1 hypothetical protein BT62DRAFT_84027 [Guyanagaster necrorhizus MCA 3950]